MAQTFIFISYMCKVVVLAYIKNLYFCRKRILVQALYCSLLFFCLYCHCVNLWNNRQSSIHGRWNTVKQSTTLCMYKIFVKMYRIGMLICILFLFQGSRDKLCYAIECMNAPLFVPLSSTAVPGIIFLFGILLEGKVVGRFEE